MPSQMLVVLFHSFESILQKYFDNEFNIAKYQTEKFISSAFLVVFHESSSIIQAILLKKKIIAFTGDCLGAYVQNRVNLYSEIFKLKKYDLDDFDIDEKKKEVFISELKAITDNYNNYVTDNIVFDKKGMNCNSQIRTARFDINEMATQTHIECKTTLS